MSELVAVLVVAADGDPGGLLVAGRCGGGEPNPEAPMLAPACCWLTAGPGPVWRAGNPAPWARVVRALPLWWDGTLVAEGWDRARRVLWRHCFAGPVSVYGDSLPSVVAEFDPGTAGDEAGVGEVGAVEWLAVELVRAGLASRVVRLARVDGRLVEVSNG